jgi:hypothetical protein
MGFSGRSVSRLRRGEARYVLLPYQGILPIVSGQADRRVHRQVVFTIPKMLRIFFKFKRRLLGDL